MDIPLFGDEPGKRRRQINLGGASTATTQASILQDARIRRQRRQEEKRRQDSAIRIQNRWRAVKQSREVRQYLRTTFAQDVTSLTGLRCLVLLKQDNEALTRWTYATLQLGSGTEFVCLFASTLSHPDRQAVSSPSAPELVCSFAPGVPSIASFYIKRYKVSNQRHRLLE